MHELIDIWDYRAQLTIDAKRKICPPNGFLNWYRLYNMNQTSLHIIRENSLKVLESIVNTGISNEYKSLGASYVLGALTLVSEEAASAIPWLYQAFNYQIV
jgi:beta-galactosidase GanA